MNTWLIFIVSAAVRTAKRHIIFRLPLAWNVPIRHDTDRARSNEPALFFHRVSLSAPRLAGPWDPCPSSGLWLNQEDPFSLSTHRRMKMQTVTVLGTLILALHINVGDAPICPSGFIAKQALHLLGLCLKQEPNAKILWHDSRMMVFHMRLTVPVAILAPQYWCDNPNHQKTEKPENVLHRSGRLCVQNYEKFSLITTPKAITLFPP